MTTVFVFFDFSGKIVRGLFISKAVVETLKGIKRNNLVVLYVHHLCAVCVAFVYLVVWLGTVHICGYVLYSEWSKQEVYIFEGEKQQIELS